MYTAFLKKARKIMPLGALGAKALDIGASIVTDTYNWMTGDARNRKMMQQQEAAAKRMADYNKQIQLDIWNATNYSAQKAHMEKAGLNPGLLYGMGGSGGATTGNANAPMPDTARANIGMGIGSGSNAAELALLNAQRENIDADTKLKETEAKLKGGPQTAQTEMQTEVLAQELANKREDYQIKRLEQTLKNIENWEKQESQADRLRYIEFQTNLAMRQLEQIENEVFVSSATINDQITKIRQEAIGAALQNELTKEQTKIPKEQIKKWAEEIAQNWETIDISKFKAEIDANYPGMGSVLGKMMNTVIESIGQRTRGKSRRIEKVEQQNRH